MTTDAGSDAGGIVVDTSNSVLQRNKHSSRDGQFVQPMLSRMKAMSMKPDTAFNMKATFTVSNSMGMQVGDGMWASPLYLEHGPGGQGIYVAATTSDTVIAFDETGAQVWKKNLGSGPAGITMGCGGASPVGILGTPVIDATAGPDGVGTIYVVAAIGTTTVDHYDLHALSAMDGTERMGGWPVVLDSSVVATNDGMSLPFTASDLDQRGALSLVNGLVYIPFGGPQGDCGPYHGWVVAVDTTNPKKITAWAARGEGGGIWSPGGLASDGTSVFAATANANYNGMFGPPPMYSDSEAIVRISGTPLARADEYYPTRWQYMDINDQDMGSSNPMLMTVAGATPSSYVVALSKDSHLYMLDSQNLGTMSMMNGGGEIIDLTLSSVVHSGRTSPISYTSQSGSHIALTIDRGACTNTNAPCTAACPATPAVDPGQQVLMGLSVTPSAGPPIKVTPSWCVTVGGQAWPPMATIGNRSSSPIVTTTDGTSEPVVWVMGSATSPAPPTGTNASVLYGIDGESGATLYSGGNCANVRQYTTPIAVKGHIIAGGDGHLCSWSSQ